MSKLLIDDNPLQVLPKLAEKIGLNEAIILQQIHYWNNINEKSNNNFRDGYFWTFNSFEDWKKQFPFFSLSTIKRTISNLEKSGLVVSANYNKLKIDRTKWYRICYKRLAKLEKLPLGQIDTTIVSKRYDHIFKLTLPLPETNSENNTETKNNIHIIKNDDRGCYEKLSDLADHCMEIYNKYDLDIEEFTFAYDYIKYFYLYFKDKFKINHGKLTNEKLLEIIENINIYLIDFNEETITYMIKAYLLENQKYYSMQQFFSRESLEIYVERYK